MILSVTDAIHCQNIHNKWITDPPFLSKCNIYYMYIIHTLLSLIFCIFMLLTVYWKKCISVLSHNIWIWWKTIYQYFLPVYQFNLRICIIHISLPKNVSWSFFFLQMYIHTYYICQWNLCMLSIQLNKNLKALYKNWYVTLQVIFNKSLRNVRMYFLNSFTGLNRV